MKHMHILSCKIFLVYVHKTVHKLKSDLFCETEIFFNFAPIK